MTKKILNLSVVIMVFTTMFTQSAFASFKMFNSNLTFSTSNSVKYARPVHTFYPVNSSKMKTKGLFQDVLGATGDAVGGVIHGTGKVIGGIVHGTGDAIGTVIGNDDAGRTIVDPLGIFDDPQRVVDPLGVGNHTGNAGRAIGGAVEGVVHGTGEVIGGVVHGTGDAIGTVIGDKDAGQTIVDPIGIFDDPQRVVDPLNIFGDDDKKNTVKKPKLVIDYTHLYQPKLVIPSSVINRNKTFDPSLIGINLNKPDLSHATPTPLPHGDDKLVIPYNPPKIILPSNVGDGNDNLISDNNNANNSSNDNHKLIIPNHLIDNTQYFDPDLIGINLYGDVDISHAKPVPL